MLTFNLIQHDRSREELVRDTHREREGGGVNQAYSLLILGTAFKCHSLVCPSFQLLQHTRMSSEQILEPWEEADGSHDFSDFNIFLSFHQPERETKCIL